MTNRAEEALVDDPCRPAPGEIDAFYASRYGDLSEIGWSPRMRQRFGYLLPGHVYELVVNNAVGPSTRWIDVGGGHSILPHNVPLSVELANRAEQVVAVDPSDNVHENRYANEIHQCLFESYDGRGEFDLATFRMVVEHVNDPDAVVQKLAAVMNPGGKVIVYTVNKHSPVPFIARWTPHEVHHKVKKAIWGGEEKDTFPVVYRMNTRRRLRGLFEGHGFDEDRFVYLDDLSSTINFRLPHLLENSARKVLSSIGIRYPENNLLGIYRKR